MDYSELLINANNILKDEGRDQEKILSNDELLKEFILPGLKSSKEVLGSIYSFKSRNRLGILGKIKTFIQSKLIFTVINVIEKPSMKQQKFNELVYKAIEILIKENEELRKKIIN